MATKHLAMLKVVEIVLTIFAQVPSARIETGQSIWLTANGWSQNASIDANETGTQQDRNMTADMTHIGRLEMQESREGNVSEQSDTNEPGGKTEDYEGRSREEGDAVVPDDEHMEHEIVRDTLHRLGTGNEGGEEGGEHVEHDTVGHALYRRGLHNEDNHEREEHAQRRTVGDTLYRRVPGNPWLNPSSFMLTSARIAMAPAAMLIIGMLCFLPMGFVGGWYASHGGVLLGHSAPMDHELKFDFKTPDQGDPDGSYRLFKWCAVEECEHMGVTIHAPNCFFEDYERIHVEGTPSSVEALIARGVVTSNRALGAQHGTGSKSYVDKLIWKVLRTECFFMASKGRSRVLVMVEAVRIVVEHEGYVLVQLPSGSLLGKRMGLPVTEKLAVESPRAAAERLWTTTLNMPLESVRFIDDSVDCVDFDGYEGLRCVERSYFFKAILIHDRAPSAFSGLGLPGHRPFDPLKAVHSSWNHDERAGAFMWMKDEQPNDAAVVGAEASERMSTRSILRSLRKCCRLPASMGGMPRTDDVVRLRLWSPDNQLLLLEVGRQCTGPASIRWSAQLPSMEQMTGDTVADTARQIVGETLLLDESDVDMSGCLAWEHMQHRCEANGHEIYQNISFVDAKLLPVRKLRVQVGLESHDDMLGDVVHAAMSS